MKEHSPKVQKLVKILSYVLVAALASALTFGLCHEKPTKLDELMGVLDEKFIDGMDQEAVEDAAANAMVAALGDRWSYYLTKEEYLDSLDRKKNEYVGMGATIHLLEDGTGFEILKLEPEGGAQKAGVQVGDLVIQIDGQSIEGMDMGQITTLIRGEENTSVMLTVKRGEETLQLEVVRQRFQIPVATGTMLDDNIGLVTIANFNEGCAQQSIAAVDSLMEQGAQALLFDVRNNGGGYVSELVELLDYLLPEGDLFRSVDYLGQESVDRSDEACIELPMAVLINGDTYSAAEFFAAALREYDWGFIVGEPSVGKGHFQYLLPLSDGSAVNLSTGRYLTPNGVNLEEIGGLVPDEVVELDEQTAAALYSGTLAPEDDPQIQRAAERLLAGES